MYTGCQHIFFKSGEKTPQPVNTLVHMALNSLFGSFPSFIIVLSSLVAQRVKNLLHCSRPGFDSWVRKIPWRRKQKPSLVFLPGKSHGHRSLEDYSLWGHKSWTQLSD